MPLDDADKKFISEAVAAAMKTHGEEADKKYVTADAAGKMVEQGVKGGIEALKLPDLIGEAVKKALPAGGGANPAGGGAGDGDKGGKGKGDGTPDPQVAKLQEQLEKLEAQNREAQKAREAAEATNRSQKLQGELRAALQAGGASPGLIDAAMALLPSRQLSDGKPILVHEADGSVKMRLQRKGYVDSVDVAAGVKDWLATDEGKNYLPASGKQGTGDGAGGSPRQNSSTVPLKDGKIDFGALAGNLSISNAISSG
jgi:hypothetical protein